MEHFDTVQIFATRHLPDRNETTALDCGDGNYYARFGQVEQWLMIENATAIRNDDENDQPLELDGDNED